MFILRFLYTNPGVYRQLKQFTAAALMLRLNYYVGTFHDEPQKQPCNNIKVYLQLLFMMFNLIGFHISIIFILAYL